MAPNDNTSLQVPDSIGTNIPTVPNIPGDTIIVAPPPTTPPDPSKETSGGGIDDEGRPRPDVGVGTFGLR
jgi:hypothetical protein